MWNDEDNNPYGAFDRPDPHLTDSLHSAVSPSPYDRESTPPSSRSSSRGPPDYVSRQPDTEDEEEDNSYGARQGALSSRKRGVYDSRIEQILYENPDLPILIVDAGKNHEGGGSFIVYTIRTGDIEVRRRYSEFASLRQTLVNLHPTLVIPPIPEKHTMADYAAKPTKAKEDTAIIELRKRMLAVFLNRCRKMKEVREDGVWWRFLDPNVSWSEVLHSHPASSVPKNNLKAPPLDPANPTPAHAWLPVPSSSAKLKSTAAMTATSPSDPANTTQILGRFPPTSRTLSEQDLDPYFINFEASTRELELLLQGNIEKVNRRTLAHLSSLSADLMELGARYNGFSLSEQSPTVAAAIERIGQAADTSYIETEELSSSLGASFAEPMRESAQFASVVRSVLRYRVLKRVQEEMTREELSKKKALLESLERSEQEAKRIEQYLNSTASPSVATKPRSMSASSATSSGHDREREPHRGGAEDTASIDSDFPPTHSDAVPSASQGTPQRPEGPSPPVHRKSASGNFVTNKIFGRISHAVHGFVDVDPERTRRDQIGKTKESLIQLEQALQVSEKDVKDASAGVLQDLKRFQKEKEEDLRRYMVAYARCHLDWARKNLETWTEAKEEAGHGCAGWARYINGVSSLDHDSARPPSAVVTSSSIVFSASRSLDCSVVAVRRLSTASLLSADGEVSPRAGANQPCRCSPPTPRPDSQVSLLNPRPRSVLLTLRIAWRLYRALLLFFPLPLPCSPASSAILPIVLSRAATRRVQLTFTTSSTKRRKVVEEPRRPGATPSPSVASRARHADAGERRHGLQHHHRRHHGSPSPERPLPLPPPTLAPSESNLDSRSSASPSPRYIPAHLQEEVLGAGSKSGASRPPTPEPSGNADSPSAACAGLSLNSDPVPDMSSSDKSSAAAPQQSQREVRSSSPAVKRRVSEIAGNEQQSQDVEMETGSSEQQSSGPDSRPAQRRATSVDMIGSEENAETAKSSGGDDAIPSTGSDTVYPTPSSMSTYTASTSTRESSSKAHEAAGTSEPVPSIDEQVAMVMALMAKPLQDKQKGYVVSANWLNRVLARSSQAPRGGVIDKSAMEGEIGPVDNSDLVLVTDPSTSFKDEAGEPFVPLRPGLQMGEDFEIVSQEAWDLIMKWYGLAEQSPAIVRYAHNTNTAGGEENIQYEINPPIFTILKLSNPANGVTTQSLKDKSSPPVKTLASRHTNFQKWLRQAKELAHIDMKTRVRVWKILGGLSSTETSGVITPAASRSSSPAPGATLVPSAGSSLVLDVNTFVSLAEGSQRELLEDARDQTANEKYNGSMTLDLVGLTANDVVVLEEQIGGPGGGEWVSEASKQALSRLSIPPGNNKNGLAKPKAKTPSVSGRSSPVPETTRGRRKDGRPKGITGFGNLGNTCYMNSALQCVRSVEELTYYFLNDCYKKDLNPNNPLAHNGDVARAYANLLHVIYDEGPVSFSPKQFKHTIGRYGPAFSGYGQQDSQEFLLFLLDGLQEDLNRIKKKPYIEKPDSTDEMVHNHEALKEFANKCWDIYKARNDSVITDLFAGQYKSTLVCPVCSKVSIIFDPFNNLTLQLPVENLWSKEIFYFPHNKPPVLLDVELDKNSSIKALKEYVAKKMNTDPQRLIMAEIYKSKFYKLFDNTATIADSNIGPGDDIGIFEVESVPTNYNPDKPKKSFSMLSFSHMDTEDIPSIDSPRADRLLVPIFNRVNRPGSRYGSRQVFGAPLFAVFTREEARDYDTIFGKVLSAVATLTTRDILHETDDADSAEDEGPDSDTVVMNEEDAESADSKIKTASVEGEDGLVDVSMRDASDASKESTAKSIPRRLRNLFQMKIVKSRSEVIPLGFSSLEENKDYPLISSRLQRKPAGKPVAQKAKASRLRERPNSPVSSSDDELNDEPEPVNKRVPRTSDESDESDADSDSESGGDIYPNRMFSDSKKARNGAVEPEPQDAPLIRPGEGIVLDWSEENHDALFGADPRDKNSLRGSPTWTNVEHFPDPELAKKRQMRQNRRKKGLTLDQCLDEFGREEILSENDAWYCPRCKEHRRASKTFELWKTPDILVIHLKRFSAHRGFRDKIDDLVDFPVEGLDLTGRVRAPEPGESLIYDLFAVDNHYGGLGGGHYTAYAKNFLTGEWHEYNDAHVSKPIDPQKVVSPAAYLLFYRRRSDRPLGGKLLQEITESSVRGADSDSPADSRAESPAGEGRRLGDSSRNGSSSALAGVGAAHQAGDGGLRTVTQVRNVEGDEEDDDEEMPLKYTNGLRSGEQSLGQTHRLQGMDTEDLDPSGGMQSNPLPYVNEPAWSFDRAADAHGPSQMTAAPPESYYDEDEDEGLFDDDEDDDDAASNQAVGGGDMSDSELPMADEPGDYPPMILDDVPPVSDDEDEELPVVELRVNEEDRIVSD